MFLLKTVDEPSKGGMLVGGFKNVPTRSECRGRDFTLQRLISIWRISRITPFFLLTGEC